MLEVEAYADGDIKIRGERDQLVALRDAVNDALRNSTGTAETMSGWLYIERVGS